MRKHLLLLAIMTMTGGRAAWTQAVTFGVKGGLFATSPQNESRPYIVGPSVEIRLPAKFAIEIDALYRRIGNSTGFSYLLNGALNSSFSRDRGNSWQFPVIGKYYFRSRESWQPFVGTGWALRKTWFHNDSSSVFTDENLLLHSFQGHADYAEDLNVGAVAAAGVRFHLGRVKFAPELRYTRWGGSNHDRNPRDEGGFLLGISF